MLAYLSLLLLQPWKALSKRQRKFVWQQYIQPLTMRLPTTLVKFVLVWCWFWAMNRFGTFYGWHPLVTGVAVLCIWEVVDMILIVISRQKIVQYIQEHEAEIQRVG